MYRLVTKSTNKTRTWFFSDTDNHRV